ncbi:MAG: carbonic anhydrase [Candidatus Chromulinivorax sp.]|nr:carbonic anhydrase [Candidatus Chromulinivorax sp.]
MNLMHITLYVSLFCFVIFFLYILLYKSYFLSASKITTPDQALAELMQGNKEYNSFWNFITRAKRKSVATMQRPFAIILSCSDSRVPTEIIFNQLDLGSLFIIRNAGNVADGVVLGSIEFGVAKLEALVIIVLGHERCGAINATIDSIIHNSPEQSGHIKDIIDAIKPAAHTILEKNNISQCTNNAAKDKIINKVVKENVRQVMNNLYKNSTIIATAIDSNKIKMIGAYYDLDDGNVELIK